MLGCSAVLCELLVLNQGRLEHAIEHRTQYPSTQRTRTQFTVIHYTAMVDVETGRFTVGVFQDVAWAAKGLEALSRRASAGVADHSREGHARRGRAGREDARRRRGAARDRRRRRPSCTRPAGRGAAGQRARSGEARAWPARCAASAFRRTTAAFSKRWSRAAASRRRSTASRARPTRWPSCISYGGGNAAIGAWTGRV